MGCCGRRGIGLRPVHGDTPTLELRPMLPDALRVPGTRYEICPLVLRGWRFSLTLEPVSDGTRVSIGDTTAVIADGESLRVSMPST